jgi:hypothetical protein
MALQGRGVPFQFFLLCCYHRGRYCGIARFFVGSVSISVIIVVSVAPAAPVAVAAIASMIMSLIVVITVARGRIRHFFSRILHEIRVLLELELLPRGTEIQLPVEATTQAPGPTGGSTSIDGVLYLVLIKVWGVEPVAAKN